MKKMTQVIVLLFISVNSLWAQSINLRNELTEISKQYKVKIGIGLKCLESGDTLSFNNDHHYPMQSVYKFPLALAILHLADEGKLNLEQKVHIKKSDLHKTWSPIKEKYPSGNIDLSISELLYYSVSLSDNNACDILFGIAGGTQKTNEYIHSIGHTEIQIAATEHQMHQDWKTQYSNWVKPMEMNTMLEHFFEGRYLSKKSNDYLLKLMIESSNSAKRIKGLLPENIIVAHKTGTSGGNKEGLIAATNDVGIISLENGRHLLISVFLTNGTESLETNENIIAIISKTCFDYYSLK